MLLIERYAERIERSEDGTVTLALRKPAKTAEGEVGFLTLRRPTLDDIVAQRKQPGDEFDQVAWLIARIGGVTVQALDGIDGEDSLVLSELVAGYLDRLPGSDRYVGDLPDRYAARITWHDDGATFVLRTPLATHEGEVAAVTLRRPTFKEMRTNRDASAGNVAASAKLLSILSGIGPLTLGKIDALDGMILSAVLSRFLGNFPETGAA